jgi:hypothetical protein
MLICTKCQIEYEEGKKFCKNCGSPLSAKTESSSKVEEVRDTEEENSQGIRICPRCQAHYEGGKYCRKCGSILMELSPSWTRQEPLGMTPPSVKMNPPERPSEAKRELRDAELIERKSVKKLSKEWLTLFKEKEKLEILIKNLEAKRTSISSDMFNTTLGRYQSQLESISLRYQKIEKHLESIKVKTSEEINLTVDAVKPFKKRLQEAQSLYKAAALTRTDFAKERTGLKKEISLRENTLKKHKQVISSLPDKMGGKLGAPGKVRNLLQPIPLAAGGIIILIAVAGYFLWPKYSYENQAQDVEKMKSLFENIRQANIQKNIDLFMSCYSLDFKDRDGKKKSTLENWQDFDYFDLSYDLKSQAISGDTASAKVGWVIKFSPKGGGQAQETKSFLDVTLKKEEGVWKIKEIKPVS